MKHSFSSISLSFFSTLRLPLEQEHTDAGVKQITFHNSTSNELVVRAEWMSRLSLLPERESFHVPAKRLAQPFWVGSGFLIISCHRTTKQGYQLYLLPCCSKSFSSDQYRALTGDLTFKHFMLISIYRYYFFSAKI